LPSVQSWRFVRRGPTEAVCEDCSLPSRVPRRAKVIGALETLPYCEGILLPASDGGRINNDTAENARGHVVGTIAYATTTDDGPENE
jgi:hypothetical protein